MFIHLKSADGHYVSAEGGGGGPVVANRAAANAWETFQVIHADATPYLGLMLYNGDGVHLKVNNGNFMCAEGGGGREVVANRPAAAGWETFTLVGGAGAGVLTSGSTVSLRASNGQYVCAEGGGGGAVNANRTAIGAWETFTVEILAPPAATAIVLSGGGSHGDFEVGALRYLFDHGHVPDIVCGTSAGSINAVKVAEGEGRATAGAVQSGLAGLEAIWHDQLMFDADMWEKQPFLKDLSAAAQDFARLSTTVSHYLMQPPMWPLLLAQGSAELDAALGDLSRALYDATRGAVQSLFRLDPIAAKLRDPQNLNLDLVARSNVRLLMATVCLESGALRYVTGQGEILERDVATGVLSRKPTLDPACQPLAAALADQQSQLEEARGDLDGAVGSAKAGVAMRLRRLSANVARAAQALDACIRSHPAVFGYAHVDVVQGALASSSIPFVFPPVQIEGETYVDGGIRAVVPVEAAILDGATDVFVVVASARGAVVPATSLLSPGTIISSFTNAGIADIAARATADIMPDELSRASTDPLNGWSNVTLTVIQPGHDIHDILTIDPGLIDIRIAHGYMAADDAIACKKAFSNPTAYRSTGDPGVRAFYEARFTDQIVRLRKAIWDVEEKLAPSDPLDSLRALKRQLKDLVDSRAAAGGALPAFPTAAATWSLRYERHRDPWQGSHPQALWDAHTGLGRLTVTASPASARFGQPATVTVSAADGTKKIAAGVFVNGVQPVDAHGAGWVTDVPFTFTFEPIIGDDLPTGKGRPTRPVKEDPLVTVRADGYSEADVPLRFS